MLNSDQILKKYKFGLIVITGMMKLIKLFLLLMIYLFTIKCGHANRNFLAMFLNIKNTGKEFSMNLCKFKLSTMNLKKLKLP